MFARNRNLLAFIFCVLFVSTLGACTIAQGAQLPTPLVVQETVLVIVTSTPAPETTTPTGALQPTAADLTATPSITVAGTPTSSPSPRPVPSLTPLALLNVPIEGGDPNHAFYALLVYPFYEPAATRSLWFRVYAHEPVSSKVDGKNINNVTFSIQDSSGVEVYFHEEKTAGYCAFGGGEPTCNVYDFASHNFTWDGPNGVKIKMKTGIYKIHVIATDNDQNDMFGDSTFAIQVP